MDLRRAPALLPACGFVLGLLLGASSGPEVPVWKASLLFAGGAARGGPVGAIAIGAAAGLVTGALAREEVPTEDPDLVSLVEGRICGVWKRRPDLPTLSARLCPEWMRQGGRLLLRPPSIWLDLSPALAPPAPGSTVLVRGRLGRFAGFANEDSVAPGPWRLRIKSRAHLAVVRSPDPVSIGSDRLRRRVIGLFASAGDPRRPGLALARGFVLGDDAWLSEELRRVLRRCGLAHLLAVSGFNLTVLALAASFLAGWAGRHLQRLAPLLVISLYLAAVGPEPSLLRAAGMAGVAMGALSLGRTGSAAQALALAAVALLWSRPALLWDAGFLLSFGATAGLVVLAARWTRKLSALPTWMAATLAATLSAQVGAWPFSAAAFSEISPSAPLFNLLAAPWATAWMLGAFLWTLAAALSTSLARALLPILDAAAMPLAWLAHLPPSPWIAVWVPPRGLAGLTASLIVAALVEATPRMRRIASLALIALAWTGAAARSRPAVSVSFLDVGQGDAALVAAGRLTILIDGGGSRFRDVGREVLWPALARAGRSSLDVAVVSHPDLDHCGGLADLAGYVSIGEVWSSPAAASSDCVARLRGRADRLRIVRAGERWERDGIRLDVLAAGELQGGPDNEDSLVLRADLEGRSFLFTGDLVSSEELRLAHAAPEELASDVLKVAHHGSSSSSEPLFLRSVGAKQAVISDGRNNAFGHPSRQTLERLRAAGFRVIRTDQVGEVRFFAGTGHAWRLVLPALPP